MWKDNINESFSFTRDNPDKFARNTQDFSEFIMHVSKKYSSFPSCMIYFLEWHHILKVERYFDNSMIFCEVILISFRDAIHIHRSAWMPGQ